MKVLQINSVCGIGSTGRIATDINKILIEKGHESYIAYGRDVPKGCDKPIRIGSEFLVYINAFKNRIFDTHGFGSKRATKAFIKEVKKISPDIIHLHNIHGYYINIEILFKYIKETNMPVVWTLHDCWTFTGHCAYFDYAGCEKWKTGCFKCPEKNSYPSSYVFDNSKNNFLRKKSIFTGVKNLTIVTPSKWLGDLVKKSFLKEYPVKIINNGIDLNTFKPNKLINNFKKKHNIEDKFMILGVASTWDRRKGLKYFIELAEKISEDEVIVLVGLSEKQIKEMPINIIGITKTYNVEDLVEIYSNADVFVNPTLEDNFPTTNLESLASGTPVITFNTGGSIESIDENTGCIVYQNNVEDLYKGIQDIKLNNEGTSKKCVMRAHTFYNKDDRYIDYLQLYEEILKK